MYLGATMSATIPDNLKDLLEKPIVVGFATTNPDGQPQVTPVWCSLEGDQVWINSAVGRRKDKNVRAQPKVTVLVIDPADAFHWVEVRGEIVEFDESEAALDHINKLAGMYAGNDEYYSFNPDSKGKEQRVIYKIQPSKVNGM
jgi:PPOX class probable F420-dependent enzyme